MQGTWSSMEGPGYIRRAQEFHIDNLVPRAVMTILYRIEVLAVICLSAIRSSPSSIDKNIGFTRSG